MTSAWKIPSRLDALWFHVRVLVHVLRRALRNSRARLPRHEVSPALVDAPVLAEHHSPLWRDGREEEFVLVAGKVHNLRHAHRAFDGVVVPAGAVFSFWRQLGRPSRRRGFVEGREVREGCVVPTVAGGLCQLSNALATCAVRAGLTLVERHGHTARIESAGAPPPNFIDATVFWNYVDLRLSAPFAFRIEVELTADELVVRLRGHRPVATSPAAAPSLDIFRAAAPPARGCLTCNETACFRHRERAPQAQAGRTAVLVNAWTPEFAVWLEKNAAEADWLLPWVRPARRAHGSWEPPAPENSRVALLASLRRTLLLRLRAGEGGGRQAAVLQGDRWLAEAFAARLRPEHTHLVVDQSLVAPLWKSGALAGRRYDVLVQALPAADVQGRLDAASERWPGAASLSDFRADDDYCVAELQGLIAARTLLTPHAEAARALRMHGARDVVQLEWQRPASPARLARTSGTPPTVVFPASVLARKGALELAAALRELGWRLIVLGTPARDGSLWQGIEVEYVTYRDRRWLERADVVILPAHVEHAPRALLLALAHGLPVVATAACGLPAQPGLMEVPAGDVEVLVRALRAALPPA